MAYLEHHYYTGPNPSTERALIVAKEAFNNRMRVLKAFDSTHADIECVFSYWPGVVERINAKKRLRIVKTSDGSGSDDDVVDPTQSKRAKPDQPSNTSGSSNPPPAKQTQS